MDKAMILEGGIKTGPDRELIISLNLRNILIAER
jgi:hypothetical protein